MKDVYVDLHVHTNYSDGSFTPEETVRYAQKIGLCGIAITDHDITDAIAPAIKEGAKRGIEIVPGIELSVDLEDNSIGEMHILGYYLDWENTVFQNKLKQFRETRKERAIKILEKLSENGITLDQNKLLSGKTNIAIGRLHIAKMMHEQGFVRNIKEAFTKYLANNMPAYVPKFKLSPEEAIGMIKSVKGIAVLAHPYYGNLSDKTFLSNLIKMGLSGIEAWHTKHSLATQEKFTEIAHELNLLITGGSDCHGTAIKDKPLMGTQNIPYEALLFLKKTKHQIDHSV